MSNTREKAYLILPACFLVSLATSCAPDTVSGTPARLWLNALAKADGERTIELAAKITGSVEKNSPNSKYTAILAKNGVRESFLMAPLNQTDFELWYYAWLLKKILKDNGIMDLKSDDVKLKATMKMVSARIARKEDPKGPLPWPALVWARRYGLCDRMSWLFAEFAYQMGLDTRIVYLMNPDTKVSPHTICEICGKNGAVWTADPYSGILLMDTSIANLAADPKLIRTIWPNHPNWWRALPHSVCWIPAMPQDYRIVNQKLRKILVAKLGDDCPRFGEDPNARLEKLKNLAGKNDKYPTKLWFFPIRLMKMELKLKRERIKDKK